MTIDSLLSRLDGVRPTNRGWVARCPAHTDKTPSLSIREGERGILGKCWAGCSLEAICEGLGIHVRDLFYENNGNPQPIRRRHVERQYKKAIDEVERMAEGFQIDAVREAERYLKATVGADISTLDSTQLDALMNSVCDALAVILEEERRGEHAYG